MPQPCCLTDVGLDLVRAVVHLQSPLRQHRLDSWRSWVLGRSPPSRWLCRLLIAVDSACRWLMALQDLPYPRHPTRGPTLRLGFSDRLRYRLINFVAFFRISES